MPLILDLDLETGRQIFQVLSNEFSGHIYSNLYILLNFCTNLIANLYNNYRILKLMNNNEYWQNIGEHNYRSCHQYKMLMASEACRKPRKIHCGQCEFSVM